MAATAPVDRTYDQNIDGILSGERWDSLNLTYSFPFMASVYGDQYGIGEDRNNFQPISPLQRETVRKVFAMISDVANLSFVEIQETSSQRADLRFARSDEPSTAWTYLPTKAPEAGDTWFRTSGGWF